MELKKRLDRTFERIITLLQKNARLSNKELATQVGLAPSSCLERVRSLQEAGVFKGFHADVAPEAIGIGLQAIIAIRLNRHSRDSLEDFKAYVKRLPEVHAVYHMAGVNDFFLHVAVRDSNHLLALNLNHFSTRPEVAHIETALIFEYHRNPILPSYLSFPSA
jgi:DNA-binding Lrp family transcriptional regulator